jgi:hypothetical protein
MSCGSSAAAWVAGSSLTEASWLVSETELYASRRPSGESARCRTHCSPVPSTLDGTHSGPASPDSRTFQTPALPVSLEAT